MAKTRILAIGGGVGTISAVYALTLLPGWRDRFDITVCQRGWRLGGKGASGRNVDFGHRIEEHGLHVWAGFYQNAFRSLRSCYGQLAELGLRRADDPLGTFDSAFKPLHHLFLAEDVRRPDGSGVDWRPWLIDLPRNAERPGDATTTPEPFALFRQLLATLLEFLERHELSGPGRDELLSLRKAHREIHNHAIRLHDKPHRHLPSQRTVLTDLIVDMQQLVHGLETPSALQDDGRRRLLLLLDAALAYMHGLAASDAFASGYDALDEWEFSDWLRANGASQLVLDSVLVRGCYDFVFGFPAGKLHRGNVGAGTAARAMGRLVLTYSGAIFWKMQAGMGDVVFAPYYQVLDRLGVKFEFFNVAKALRLSPDQRTITRIDMVRQATTRTGPYRPLKDVRGLPCWPSEPDWSQLQDGDRLRREGADFESEEHPPTGTDYTLELGRDFDQVLLGASLGSLAGLTEDLTRASPRWSRMLDSLRSVATRSAQFWLGKSAADLGWDRVVAQHNNAAAIPKPPLRTILTGFAEPLDTWADMSHLIPVEDWPDPGPVSIAYFCSPATDGETRDDFKQTVRRWMTDRLPAIWPDAGSLPFFGGGFDDQYFRVNRFGSERYVLSVAGSVFHRLAPDESGFANLVLAGDWTRCGLNAGCVEAATMSGIAAATALSGEEIPNVGADDIAEEETVLAAARYQTLSVTGASWPLTGVFALGEMTGWFLFYALPRAEVAAMLPPGVHLGTSRLVPAGMHPVGMSFCRYRQVRGSYLPGFLALPEYDEATFAIPDTRTDDGGQAPFLFPRCLYVNSEAAILSGKVFYAMNKRRARMTFGNRTFTADNDQGLRLSAEFDQTADPVSLVNHPAIGTLSGLLGSAFVTHRDRRHLLYNAFDLHLDRTWVAPVSARVSVFDRSAGGFPAAELQADPLSPDTPRGLPGALRIWCSWSMTHPFDSTRVRHAAKAAAFLDRVK